MVVDIYSQRLKQKKQAVKSGVSFSIQLICVEAESSSRFVGNIPAAETKLLSSKLCLAHC